MRQACTTAALAIRHAAAKLHDASSLPAIDTTIRHDTDGDDIPANYDGIPANCDDDGPLNVTSLKMRAAGLTTHGRVAVKGGFITNPALDPFVAALDSVRVRVHDRREIDMMVNAAARSRPRARSAAT